MSERIGDNARFGRERKKQGLQRARTHELRKVLELDKENKQANQCRLQAKQSSTVGVPVGLPN